MRLIITAIGLVAALLIATIVITALAIGRLSQAHAHGAAQWIMDDSRTYHCCGPEDCYIVADTDVVLQADGWYVRGKKVPDENVYPVRAPTPIGQISYWACFYQNGKGDVRCLFLPGLSWKPPLVMPGRPA